MIDLITALTFSICSKNPLVIKVLGPTADYMGDGLKSFTEKQIQNLAKIFNRSSEKLNRKKISTGAVPPRILKHILDEGSYVDNELAAEYFSGALAGSKSDRSRDDRALTILKLLSSMSIYEIRFHYIFYSTFRETFLNYNKFNITNTDQEIKHQLFFPEKQFIDSFVIEKGENIDTIIEHAIPGLCNKNLIGKHYSYGDKDFIKLKFKSLDNAGIVTSPSLLGTQLYLAAHGYLDISANRLCDSSLALELWDGVEPLKDVVVIK